MKKFKNVKKHCRDFLRPATIEQSQDGFSLMEVIVALGVFLVVMLGMVTVFTYAVNYNSGNNARAKSLAVLQQEVEQFRSAKFTPRATDSTLTGGTKNPKTVTLTDGSKFRIQTEIDDDPSTPAVDTLAAPTLKEIKVTVTLDNPTPGWQTAIPARVVLRRTRAN